MKAVLSEARSLWWEVFVKWVSFKPGMKKSEGVNDSEGVMAVRVVSGEIMMICCVCVCWDEMNQNSVDEAVTVMPGIDTRDVFKGAVCVISNDEDVDVITTAEVGGLRGLYVAFQLRYYV